MNISYTTVTLHDAFRADKFDVFRDLLRSSKKAATGNAANWGNLSNSMSKSPRWESVAAAMATHAASSVVNRRDIEGRTTLHLVVSSANSNVPAYIELLLESPYININLQDYESGWTALHRALYVGNLSAARLLMNRSDCDATIKDHEGRHHYSRIHNEHDPMARRLDSTRFMEFDN